jgi:hypothetical protein
MKKIYIFILLFLLLINVNVYAEFIDGPANIRENPNGKAIFQLNNNAKVTCNIPENNWYFVGLRVYIKEQSLINNAIKKGEILYDLNGNEIGKTLGVVYPWTDIEYDNELKRYKLTIVGYTYKNNIQENFVIENVLAKLINEKNKPIILSKLQNHIKEYEYQHWFQEKDFDSYLYSKSWLNDSPGVRVILIFYKKQLCALIYTTEIKLTHYQFKKVQKNYKIVYIEDLDNKTKDELEQYYFGILLHAG